MQVSKPSITSLEKKYVNEALAGGNIGYGEFLTRFENEWASWNQYKHGVAVSSGTAALFLALKALGVGPGDEVIVPEFTMVSSAWAVTYTGATPVFVDCDDTLNMPVGDVIQKITPRTKVIMPVHVYGRKFNTKGINIIATQKGIKVVEDMAEGHGILPEGDIACYSFMANKIISTGEGGMCITTRKDYADEIRRLSTLYFDKERSLIHEKVGYNFKMTNIQAAIGLAQVERIDEILDKRWQIESWYDKAIPDELKMTRRDVLWMYDVKVGPNRNKIKAMLAERDIESRYFFKPMSMQPMYYKTGSRFLNAYKQSCQGLYLPTFTDMKKNDVNLVAKNLIEVYEICKKETPPVQEVDNDDII